MPDRWRVEIEGKFFTEGIVRETEMDAIECALGCLSEYFDSDSDSITIKARKICSNESTPES
jgi:hypothetical protein